MLAHSDGFANVRAKRPFGLRTLCRLHGCTKPLVAAAFLTLVDKGKVKLSDPIGKYISFSGEVSGKGRGKRQRLKARKVKVQPTLRHLLTMTAGLQYQDRLQAQHTNILHGWKTCQPWAEHWSSES